MLEHLWFKKKRLSEDFLSSQPSLRLLLLCHWPEITPSSQLKRAASSTGGTAHYQTLCYRTDRSGESAQRCCKFGCFFAHVAAAFRMCCSLFSFPAQTRCPLMTSHPVFPPLPSEWAGLGRSVPRRSVGLCGVGACLQTHVRASAWGGGCRGHPSSEQTFLLTVYSPEHATCGALREEKRRGVGESLIRVSLRLFTRYLCSRFIAARQRVSRRCYDFVTNDTNCDWDGFTLTVCRCKIQCPAGMWVFHL